MIAGGAAPTLLPANAHPPRPKGQDGWPKGQDGPPKGQMTSENSADRPEHTGLQAGAGRSAEYYGRSYARSSARCHRTQGAVDLCRPALHGVVRRHTAAPRPRRTGTRRTTWHDPARRAGAHRMAIPHPQWTLRRHRALRVGVGHGHHGRHHLFSGAERYSADRECGSTPVVAVSVLETAAPSRRTGGFSPDSRLSRCHPRPNGIRAGESGYTRLRARIPRTCSRRWDGNVPAPKFAADQ